MLHGIDEELGFSSPNIHPYLTSPNPRPLTTMQDPMSAAAKLVLTLFSAVFDVLTKYPQTDNILLPNFASLIRHCLTASCNAANPTGGYIVMGWQEHVLTENAGFSNKPARDGKWLVSHIIPLLRVWWPEHSTNLRCGWCFSGISSRPHIN